MDNGGGTDGASRCGRVFDGESWMVLKGRKRVGATKFLKFALLISRARRGPCHTCLASRMFTCITLSHILASCFSLTDFFLCPQANTSLSCSVLSCSPDAPFPCTGSPVLTLDCCMSQMLSLFALVAAFAVCITHPNG